MRQEKLKEIFERAQTLIEQERRILQTPIERANRILYLDTRDLINSNLAALMAFGHELEAGQLEAERLSNIKKNQDMFQRLEMFH